MNAAFHSLIGGIEAVTHYITRYQVSLAEQRIIPSAATDSPEVTRALADLAEIKLSLLDAECRFMSAVSNMDHVTDAWGILHPGVPAPVPVDQRAIPGLAVASSGERQQMLTNARIQWNESYEAHCNRWITALDSESAKLANAIHVLQFLAPEWSTLDRRLSQLMEDFKQSASTIGGTGSPGVSLGSNFPPGSRP